MTPSTITIEGQNMNEIFNEFLLSIANEYNISVVQELRHKWKMYLSQPVIKAPSPKVEREPLFTTEDGVNVHGGETFYAVDVDLDIREQIAPSEKPAKGQRLRWKWFSTEEKAKEYVTLNKPFMSVQDVMNRLNAYFTPSSRIPAFDNIKAFAQQKINPESDE